MFRDGPCAYIANNAIVFHYVKDNSSDRVVWLNFKAREKEGKYTYVNDLHHYNIRRISFDEFINNIASYVPENSLNKKAKVTINKIFDYYAK